VCVCVCVCVYLWRHNSTHGCDSLARLPGPLSHQAHFTHTHIHTHPHTHNRTPPSSLPLLGLPREVLRHMCMYLRAWDLSTLIQTCVFWGRGSGLVEEVGFLLYLCVCVCVCVCVCLFCVDGSSLCLIFVSPSFCLMIVRTHTYTHTYIRTHTHTHTHR
jgi:hypothetical protein